MWKFPGQGGIGPLATVVSQAMAVTMLDPYLLSHKRTPLLAFNGFSVSVVLLAGRCIPSSLEGDLLKSREVSASFL